MASLLERRFAPLESTFVATRNKAANEQRRRSKSIGYDSVEEDRLPKNFGKDMAQFTKDLMLGSKIDKPRAPAGGGPSPPLPLLLGSMQQTGKLVDSVPPSLVSKDAYNAAMTRSSAEKAREAFLARKQRVNNRTMMTCP